MIPIYRNVRTSPNEEYEPPTDNNGIQTIVDPTPNDTGGRDPLLYKELSNRTGINIICTTGFYTEKEGGTGLLGD
jgi:predicted metal-dependent phosphotriesterase family hydrolase